MGKMKRWNYKKKTLFGQTQAQIITGDSRKALKKLPPKSVDCIITGPPYFNLRDYDMEDQIGLGGSLSEYIKSLVFVFREAKRVLKDDGTLWCNMGDSYISKKLMLVPARLALALQEDGWMLRSDIIWSKPNAMPESVEDRPNNCHEHIFLFSKKSKYYYDSDAVKEKAVGNHSGAAACFKRKKSKRAKVIPNQQVGTHRPDRVHVEYSNELRNRRSVWTVSTLAYRGAHFAVYPPKLISPCVLAGCPKGGVILDPFNGSGTTGVVALKHNRNYIGIELNPEYVELSKKRIIEESK